MILLLSATGLIENDGPPTFNHEQCILKEDVLCKRGSLGRMLKVFIYYVSTVKCTTGEIKGKLEKRIYNFSSHLITYGFDVRVDLFCDQSRSFDRAAWSDHELSQANWVIFVCSRSSYELLQLSNSSEQSVAYTSCLDREMLNNITVLRKILYNRLSVDISTRVIPVILLEEDNNIAFVPPSLQDPHNILCIFEDTPFDYEKLDGHFERLICRMAGINRIAINNSGQNRGYIKLPSKCMLRTSVFAISSVPHFVCYIDRIVFKNYHVPAVGASLNRYVHVVGKSAYLEGCNLYIAFLVCN